MFFGLGFKILCMIFQTFFGILLFNAFLQKLLLVHIFFFNLFLTLRYFLSHLLIEFNEHDNEIHF